MDNTFAESLGQPVGTGSPAMSARVGKRSTSSTGASTRRPGNVKCGLVCLEAPFKLKSSRSRFLSIAKGFMALNPLMALSLRGQWTMNGTLKLNTFYRMEETDSLISFSVVTINDQSVNLSAFSKLLNFSHSWCSPSDQPWSPIKAMIVLEERAGEEERASSTLPIWMRDYR